MSAARNIAPRWMLSWIEEVFCVHLLHKLSYAQQIYINIIHVLHADRIIDDVSEVDASLALVYGLIHARYIITANGLSVMVST